MLLTNFQTNIRELSLMQTQWLAQLNPVLANPTTNLSLLKGITLATGDNVINHKLGQLMQGWLIVDVNAAVSIYRSQPLNNLTLTLNSSGPATINLAVF